MRYRKPFTLAQRQQAISVYHAYRAQLSTIRQRFRPHSREERAVYSQLRTAIEDFAVALRAPDAKVNIDRLNDFRVRADHLAVLYSLLKLGRREP
jgi:hypothetical protein